MSALIILTAASLVGTVRAADILLPSYTPKTTSDFGSAEDLTAQTLSAIHGMGGDIASSALIEERAGEVADGCAEEPACVPSLWDGFPTARLVVVGDVTRTDDTLTSTVRFYAPGDPSPVEVLSDTFPATGAADFADQVAFFAVELVKLVPERGAVVARIDEEEPEPPDPPELIAAAPPPPEPEPPKSITVTEYYPPITSTEPATPVAPAKKSSDPTPPERPPLDDDLSRKQSGLPPVAWDRYQASGLSYADWKEKAFVRTGRIILEAWGGFALGDVDRVYDTRVALDQTGGVDDPAYDQVATYQYESFIQGDAFTLGGALGYAPAWWVEFGVSGSAIFATKSLSTGWEHYHDGTLVEAQSETLDPVSAQVAVIEPRLRLYFVATGTIKPFVMGAGNIRLFDGYTVPDLAEVDYPNRDGGVGFGVSGGAGLAFDLPGGAIALIEVPWTAVLSPEPFLSGGQGLQDLPAPVTGVRQMLTFRAGLGLRL